MSPTNKRSSTIPLLWLVIALFVAVVTILISLQAVSSRQLKTTVGGTNPGVGPWPNPIGSDCCRPYKLNSPATASVIGTDPGSFFGSGTQAQAQANALAIAGPQMTAQCNDVNWLWGKVHANSFRFRVPAKPCADINNELCEADGNPSGTLGASTPGACTFTQISTGWFGSIGWKANCTFSAMCSIELACKQKDRPVIVDLLPDPFCENPTVKTGSATSSYMNFSETDDLSAGSYAQQWQDLKERVVKEAQDYFDNICSVYSPPIDCHPNCEKTQYTSGGVADNFNYFYLAWGYVTPPGGGTSYMQADLHCAFATCSAQQECELKEDPDDGDTSSDTTGAGTDTGSGYDGMDDGMYEDMYDGMYDDMGSMGDGFF